MLQINRQFIRTITSKSKRIVLQQNPENIPVYEGKASSKNRLYAWGFQETGALGLQTNVKKAQEKYTQTVNYPTRLKFSENCDVEDVCAGYGFSLMSVNRSDGETLFATGINTDSQLGFQGNLDVVIYPTAVQLP
uniref:Uncharacterized protein n=1 Tax=Megaselia scalaris TaxID=36166 RepID=T1GL27_MEGSC